MNYFFYILYSPSLDRFYYGHTSDLDDRLRKHNSNHKGFTGQCADWKIVYMENYLIKEDAYSRERQVKGWKNRRLVEELVRKSLSNQ